MSFEQLHQDAQRKAGMAVAASLGLAALWMIFMLPHNSNLPLREDYEAACIFELENQYIKPNSLKIDQFQFGYALLRGTGGKPPKYAKTARIAAYYHHLQDYLLADCEASPTKGKTVVTLHDVRIIHR